jgi:hypothetical protein
VPGEEAQAGGSRQSLDRAVAFVSVVVEAERAPVRERLIALPGGDVQVPEEAPVRAEQRGCRGSGVAVLDLPARRVGQDGSTRDLNLEIPIAI